MTDKHLSAAAWKHFAKGTGLEAHPLCRALAKLENARHQGPLAQVRALEAVDLQIRGLSAERPGDRRLACQLSRLNQAVQACRRAAESAHGEQAPALRTSRLSKPESADVTLEKPHALQAQRVQDLQAAPLQAAGKSSLGHEAGPPSAGLQQCFEERLAAIEPLLAAALQVRRDDAAQMRAVAAFAREKGRSGSPAVGLKALDALDQLLNAAALKQPLP